MMKKKFLLIPLVIMTNLAFSADLNSLSNASTFANNQKIATPIADIDINGQNVDVDVTKLRTLRPSFLGTIRSIRSLESLQLIDSIGSTNLLNVIINSI